MQQSGLEFDAARTRFRYNLRVGPESQHGVGVSRHCGGGCYEEGGGVGGGGDLEMYRETREDFGGGIDAVLLKR